ncbi:MAG: hypothetical protein IJV89_04420 [Lentisphaeria bacterium]|nr:hypothetical protein [Lentisphaeria bacterium]
MKKILFLSLSLFLAAGLAAAERQLKVESVRKFKTPDGRTIQMESLGLPLTPKPASVEFVTTTPDGEKIAWGVFRGALEHYVVGYGEKSGRHLIDLTKYYGLHSYKPTIAPYKGFIYILAGNRGPALLKYEIATRKITEIHRFKAQYYWLGHTVDSRGRIFWGISNNKKNEALIMGIDPATDKIILPPKLNRIDRQTYALSPAIDDNDIAYIPLGMNTPDLCMMDLKTMEAKSILTDEEKKILKKMRVKLPAVRLIGGKVYTRFNKKIYECTPAGLKPAPEEIRDFPLSWICNTRFPGTAFRPGWEAFRFTSEGLILKNKQDQREWIPIKGLPVIGHEIYSVGGVHKGKIYGSGIFKGHVFSVDLKTLKATDYGLIGRSGVQQYDLASTPYGVLFCGYTGGYFDLLDPERPIRKGINPKPVWDLNASEQERPFRLTAADASNTVFYTGSMATKNRLPGALTKIDLKTGNHKTWRNIIPNQSIMDVVVVPGTKLLFGTSTVSGGTGSKATKKEAQIFLFDPEQEKVIWQDNPLKKPCVAYQGTMVTADGRILFVCRVASKEYIWLVFDPATRKCKIGKKLPYVTSGRFVFAEKRPVNGKNYFTCQGYFYEFDPAKDTVIPLFKDKILNDSNYIHFAEEDQYMYFRYEAQLMRWKFVN